MIEYAWNYRSVVAKDINNSEGCGSVSKYAPRYFKIDWTKANKDWEYVLCIGDNTGLTIGANYKSSYNVKGNVFYMITGYPFASKENEYYAFSYTPLYVNQNILDEFGIQHKGGIQTFEDIIQLMSSIISVFFSIEVNLSTDGLTEITEEEFYKID